MNKLIVVTGGTKGIGRAVLEKFAAMGFDVATCARKTEELERLKSALINDYPGTTVYVKSADLSDKQQVTGFCDFVRSLGRSVDVLVNNAGYFVPGAITTEPEGTLESMINANLYSAYYTTRGLIALMKEKKAGHVFNICSIASFTAYSNGGSYAISKFAMLGLSKCLRAEVKEFGIRVTAVMPGATMTDSWAGTQEADERFMKTEDVAETIYAAYALSGRTVMEEVILRPQLGDL